MEVIITEWGLDSYLKLKKQNVFTDAQYRATLRPDAELLKTYPADPKFQSDKFWGPAESRGKRITNGHKMKWHNFGQGQVQLRMCVAILTTELEDKVEERAFLCRSYIKDNHTEKRNMARFKINLQKIIDGNFKWRGKL